MVGESAPRGVDTGHGRTLRSAGVSSLLIASLGIAFFYWFGLRVSDVVPSGGSIDHRGLTDRLLVTAIPAVLLAVFVLWARYRRGVQVDSSGLVVRRLLSSRTVRWDEIDAVRLERLEFVNTLGKLSSYAPVLEFRDGDVLLLRELGGQSTSRRLPRSRLTRNVATIASYLEQHRTHDQGSATESAGDG